MLDNNSHYPKKMVIFLFLTLGTLYQLILFPILVSLIMWNKDIGLAYAVAILTPAVNPVELNLGDFSYAA